MFSQQFRDTPVDEIVHAVRHKGFFAMENAIDAAVADQILADVDNLEFQLNRNIPPNVVHKGQTYANHYLARSRTAFDLVTSDRVTGVLRGGLGDVFRMVGKRVYETRNDFYMQFHSDTAAVCNDPMQIDTIVFIAYLNDVTQGEWEIVEGSHLWGETTVGSRENDEELVNRPDVKVVGLKMPRGSLVIYNGRTLHRARMFHDRSWARRSLFFQVNRNARDGEPILVDTTFIHDGLSADAKMLLGFGQKATMAPFPPSSMKSVPVGMFKSVDDYLLQALPIDKLAALKRLREAEEAQAAQATTAPAS